MGCGSPGSHGTEPKHQFRAYHSRATRPRIHIVTKERILTAKASRGAFDGKDFLFKKTCTKASLAQENEGLSVDVNERASCSETVGSRNDYSEGESCLSRVADNVPIG